MSTPHEDADDMTAHPSHTDLMVSPEAIAAMALPDTTPPVVDVTVWCTVTLAELSALRAIRAAAQRLVASAPAWVRPNYAEDLRAALAAYPEGTRP